MCIRDRADTNIDTMANNELIEYSKALTIDTEESVNPANSTIKVLLTPKTNKTPIRRTSVKMEYSRSLIHRRKELYQAPSMHHNKPSYYSKAEKIFCTQAK
eukprot:TRINITY_DN14115_c0_g1_i6.p3 TRINITY_DN14115_c0_g1~~TRINITY_DN14115_c0_g1_i6.p3  ORF type:complete len:101 (+),score=16.34 TRINITY_DN14115_c0_g1_i6:77-379(+)